jgi:hypothetical protein
MRLILLLSFLLAYCSPTKVDNVQQFYIGVKNYYGGEGLTFYFQVTRDSLKIYSNCDFENCSEKLEYRQRNDREMIKNLEHFLVLYRFDTLKARYADEGVLDGLFRTVTFQKNSDRIKSIRLENFDHPTIDTLLTLIEPIIKDEKFRTLK